MKLAPLFAMLVIALPLSAATIDTPKPPTPTVEAPAPAKLPLSDNNLSGNNEEAAAEPTDTTAASKHPRPATSSSVVVEATDSVVDPTSVRVTAETINTAAGAFEDPARYFQLLPGVTGSSDQRNDFMVRGGNSAENLFVIDNIDVKTISHLALATSSGGFVSMIDNAAVQSMTLHSAEHDAKFDDRLSSVVEISTVPDGGASAGRNGTRRMIEGGIAGVGGFGSRTIGDGGSLFVSGREGVLRYFTNDIGIDGVPHYNNSLVRGDETFSNGDKIWGIALTGDDSLFIHPDQSNPNSTNPIDVHYSGWRNTTGFNWQHLFSSRSFGVFTLSNAEQSQTVLENDLQAGGLAIYNEQTHDGETSFKSQFSMQAGKRVVLSGGATETMHRVHYDIVQPDGFSSNPYDANPDAPSGTNVHRNFATEEDSGYAQALVTLPLNLRLTLAGRAHHWGFGDHLAATPKASLSFPLGKSRTFSIGIADYAQMPAFLYLLSFEQNQSLAPIRARHVTAALTLVNRSRFQVALAAYRKTYRDYPVSTQFPQLSLANIGDTFGEAFLMFPMVSQGRGQASGAELSVDLRPSSRIAISGNLAYARDWYSGLDGVLRRGSADLPIVANLSAVVQAGHGVVASARYSGTSGRPFTPDNLAQSYAQNRDVYDLSQINAARSAAYGRVDFRIEKSVAFRAGVLQWHIGVDNALNRKNFYAHEWKPNTGGQATEYQMPIFPDGGVKYLF